MTDDYIDSINLAYLNPYLPPWVWPGTSRSLKPPIGSLATQLGLYLSHLAPPGGLTWLFGGKLTHLVPIFYHFTLILMKNLGDYIDNGWRLQW
jgi:hypothetical protein